jgi:hypothetical protein
MRLTRAEDPAKKGPSIVPYRHQLFKADNPSSGKDGHHIGVLCKNRLADLPELVDKCWSGAACEVEAACDSPEAVPSHVLSKIVRTGSMALVTFLC